MLIGVMVVISSSSLLMVNKRKSLVETHVERREDESYLNLAAAVESRFKPLTEVYTEIKMANGSITINHASSSRALYVELSASSFCKNDGVCYTG